MGQENIFQIMQKKYNIQREVQKIKQLFFNKKYLIYLNGMYRQQPLEMIADTYCIVHWKQRGSFLNCYEIRKDLALDDEKIEKKLSHQSIVKLLEYIKNIIYLLNIWYPDFGSLSCQSNFMSLNNNVNILIEHMGYMYQEYRKEEMVLITHNDISKKLAVDKAKQEHKDISHLIYEYEHHSLKGNIEKKKDILMNIYRTFENIFDSKSNEGFKEYIRTLNKCYNGLNIRHNNESELSKVQRDRQEEIYDKLYKFTLFCLLIKDNKKIKRELDDFYKELL